MAKLNLLQAINQALITAMTEDEKAVVFGEDVGYFGGVFRATSNLQEKFGKARCFNTPLTEQGIIGFANGLALRVQPRLLKFSSVTTFFPRSTRS